MLVLLGETHRSFWWTGHRARACSCQVCFKTSSDDEGGRLPSPVEHEAERRCRRQPLRHQRCGGWGCKQGCRYGNGILAATVSNPLAKARTLEGPFEIFVLSVWRLVTPVLGTCSVKVQRPCRPNRNLRWGSILEVAVECRVLDCGLWWQLPGFESQPLAFLLGWVQAVGLSSLLSFPYFLDEGDNSTPCRELLEV